MVTFCFNSWRWLVSDFAYDFVTFSPQSVFDWRRRPLSHEQAQVLFDKFADHFRHHYHHSPAAIDVIGILAHYQDHGLEL